ALAVTLLDGRRPGRSAPRTCSPEVDYPRPGGRQNASARPWCGAASEPPSATLPPSLTLRCKAFAVFPPLGEDQLLGEHTDTPRALAGVQHVANLDRAGRELALPFAERGRLLPRDLKIVGLGVGQHGEIVRKGIAHRAPRVRRSHTQTM